jgi:small subunit ribosomal protein S16
MLCLKLARQGKTKQPTFRLIVCEKTSDPWGSYLENLGSYNPRTKKAVLEVDRIKHWISKGAQTTDSVWNMLVTNGVLEGKKRSVSRISKTRAEKIKAKAGEATKKEAVAPAPENSAPTA